MSYLVDTNVILELVKVQPDRSVVEWFREVPSDALFISVLTIGEIRKGIEKLEASTKRGKLVVWLEQELPVWFEDRILVIDSEVAERWGYMLAKSKKIPSAVDSLIASTALVHNLKILTRNTKDFLAFPDLEIINPWD
jgi:predicted nucleic acid-binding protein